ncbi:MAG: Uncharacterized protein Athens101410_71 [Parcubacteria group bacterium Athens1014_10]|nr:MAG: Uncharacterized protein Athens101410_71 [Parcubacteria group bacterium Athens1014_10]TSD06097.1 MAG: Uncharacterized protein Athens071412_71 [Parcubacteria group bacterium Athens0714_12]
MVYKNNLEKKLEDINLKSLEKESVEIEEELSRENETRDYKKEKEIGVKKKPLKTTAAISIEKTSKTPSKSPALSKIENILEEDLESIYFSLDEPVKNSFKAKGEETALKIESLLKKAKTVFRRIFELIREWLRIIPGINKFYIEKEAEIKTKKILEIKT